MVLLDYIYRNDLNRGHLITVPGLTRDVKYIITRFMSSVCTALFVQITFFKIVKKYKKLSCGREAARRSVSLKILAVTEGGHSKLHR